MAAGLEPAIDTFANLNPGSTASIRSDVVGAAANANTTAPNFTDTELIGMGIGGPGALDASMAGLRSDFQANGAATAGTPAAPGLTPALTMVPRSPGPWTRSTRATTGIGARWLGHEDAVPGLGRHGRRRRRRLRDRRHRGQDLGEGTPHPFDRMLSMRYVNTAAQAMFAVEHSGRWDRTRCYDARYVSGTLIQTPVPTTTRLSRRHPRSGRPWSWTPIPWSRPRVRTSTSIQAKHSRDRTSALRANFSVSPLTMQVVPWRGTPMARSVLLTPAPRTGFSPEEGGRSPPTPAP